MSERMTSIRLPNSGDSGYADWGRKTKDEMIAIYRMYAQNQYDWSKRVLKALDDDFHIETYIGVHVKKNREVIQEGRK